MDFELAKKEVYDTICGLIVEAGFGDFLFSKDRMRSEMFDWREEHEIELAVFAKKQHLFYADGMTKFVIGFPDLGVVCKVPFNLTRCGFGEDFCALEAENYQRAVERGIETYFARCEYAFEINGVQFYLQEYVPECNDEITAKRFAEILPDEAQEYGLVDDNGELSCTDIDEDVMEMLFEAEWGSDATCEVIGFIRDYEINDLHSGNVGFTKRGLVLVDYSGY